MQNYIVHSVTVNQQFLINFILDGDEVCCYNTESVLSFDENTMTAFTNVLMGI